MRSRFLSFGVLRDEGDAEFVEQGQYRVLAGTHPGTAGVQGDAGARGHGEQATANSVLSL